MSQPINKIRLIDKVKVALFGHARIGDTHYFLFKCPNHGLLIDLERGYTDNGKYYHECSQCPFRYLFYR